MKRYRTGKDYPRRIRGVLAATGLAALLGIGPAMAQDSAQNEANNPLTPKITLNLHDYYVPRMFDLGDEWSNQLLFRGVIPFKAFGRGQLFRFTLPVVSAPQFPSGRDVGLGDLTVMDIIPFKRGAMEYGLGPLLVLPTASEDSLGAGKWQAGLVGLAVASRPKGILGALVTWQASFAGEDDRDDVQLLTVQPLILRNFPGGWYLRSTAIMNFNLENGDYAVPVGLGLGRVVPVNPGTTANFFLEPQYTVSHEGSGQPEWQIFAGVNFQFDLK